MKIRLFISIFLIIAATSYGNGIRFVEGLSFEQAKEQAIKEGKNIFIDTYTEWCIPCKQMSKVFADSEVGAFFNSNFVNVRVNMEYSEQANSYKNDFQIVFLPTMLIVSPDGRTRFKADRTMTKYELIAIAQKSLNPSSYLPSMTTEMESTPFHQASNTETKGPETIIHVMSKDVRDLPPEILRSEAYFRLELGDGLHTEAARAYLCTQSDWLTAQNMRFLLDFVPDTRSKEFEFLIANKPKFISAIGKNQVERTVQILIYMQLYQAFPRPNFDETQYLFKLINPDNYLLLSYQYYLSRLQDECKMKEYLNVGENYLKSTNPYDDYVMFVLANYLFENENAKDKALMWINKAIKQNANDPEYFYLSAQVYYSKNDLKNAAKSIDLAIKNAEKLNWKNVHYLKFKDLIQKTNN